MLTFNLTDLFLKMLSQNQHKYIDILQGCKYLDNRLISFQGKRKNTMNALNHISRLLKLSLI